MTSQFLSYFSKQLKSAEGTSLSSQQAIEITNKKTPESLEHKEGTKLFMAVFYPEEFLVEIISFLLKDASQLENQYVFMDMASETIPRFKKVGV